MTGLQPHCRTSTKRTLIVNGLGLHALEWGTPGRPGLCFLHGGSAHCHWWDRIAGAFAERFHVIALDQRGHGQSAPGFSLERLLALHARGRRPVRRHPSWEAARAAFRLLPPETVADPALIEHLAREALVERSGAWSYRFDPACNATRMPVDAWPLLGRIQARTLLVRGERSAIMTAQTAALMAARIGDARIVEVPGAWHHVVLDAPDAVRAALESFVG